MSFVTNADDRTPLKHTAPPLTPQLMPGQWTPEQAHAWYNQQPYIHGANYLPSDASNPIAMWQADTFNPERIATELGYLQQAGMTAVRVFMHELVYRDDPATFKENVNTFLDIAKAKKLLTLLVCWDSVWDPFAHLGPQRPPQPGVHNSRWVQSPGADLSDPSRYGDFQAYIANMTQMVDQDPRVLGLDIWNEPDNLNNDSYKESTTKWGYVLPLLTDSFRWAREQKTDKMLTSGVWVNYRQQPLHPIFDVQLQQSDIITFHDYNPVATFRDNAAFLQGTYGRPVICTEYMARPLESRFETHLPVALQDNVGMMCWGFVQGESQTHCDWQSWNQHHAGQACPEPDNWFHDVVRPDGTYHVPAEQAFFAGFRHDIATRQAKRLIY